MGRLYPRPTLFYTVSYSTASFRDFYNVARRDALYDVLLLAYDDEREAPWVAIYNEDLMPRGDFAARLHQTTCLHKEVVLLSASVRRSYTNFIVARDALPRLIDLVAQHTLKGSKYEPVEVSIARGCAVGFLACGLDTRRFRQGV